MHKYKQTHTWPYTGKISFYYAGNDFLPPSTIHVDERLKHIISMKQIPIIQTAHKNMQTLAINLSPIQVNKRYNSIEC